MDRKVKIEDFSIIKLYKIKTAIEEEEAMEILT
jgi:hypothetical protein